jgi:hypothetical protein
LPQAAYDTRKLDLQLFRRLARRPLRMLDRSKPTLDWDEVSFSRHDAPVNLPFPTALFPARKRAFGLLGAEMPDLLPLGFGCTLMIVAGLGLCAGCMGRPHIVRFVRAS